MQIEKRLEQPNPLIAIKGRVGISDNEAVLLMAEQLRSELQNMADQGFSPDAWPVRVTEFEDGDTYNVAAPDPALTLLFDAAD